jgi:heterodisulfide reductase subunit C
MRKIVRQATFGLTEIDNDDIWRCTTCGKCPQVCPRNVKQIESGVALRRLATEYDVSGRSGADSAIPAACAPRQSFGNDA